MIVRRALAPHVQDRYASAAALRGALEAFAKQQLGLDTSTDALARVLAERFGRPAWPELDTPPPVLTIVPPAAADAPTLALAPATIVTPSVRQRSRIHRVTVGVFGVLAGAVLGWQIARQSPASATEPPRSAAPVLAAAARAATATEPATVVSEPAAPTEDRAEPTIVAQPTAPVISAALARADAGEPPARRARPQRRAKKQPAAAPPIPPARSADGMLPRSAR
jgi:hypothetical protein